MEKYLVNIISVPKYKSEHISDLPFCAKDSSALNTIFIEHLGIEEENIKVLGIDPENEVKRTDILRNVRYISRKAEQDDIIIFYFSGHGFSENNSGYLATFDTELDLPSDTSIPISRIQSELKKSQAKIIMIIIDSCYSGIEYGKKINTEMTEDFENSLFSDISEGWVIFASCKRNELSYFLEDNSMSVFTFYLIEGLKGNADDDNDSNISLENLNTYVTGMVSRWAIENDKTQTPNMNMELVGTLNFEITNPDTSEDFSLKKESSNIEKSAQSIVLSSSYYAPFSRQAYGPDGFPIEIMEDIPHEERNDMLNNHNKKFMGRLFTKIINYYNPQQIKYIENGKYEFPFGKLIHNSLDFKSQFNFIVTDELFTQDITDLLDSLDEQNEIKWDSVEYIFNGNFDLDIVNNIVKEKGFSVVDFQLNENYSSLCITQKNENEGIVNYSKWKITFENELQIARIQISQNYGLEKEFFQTIPISELIDIFTIALKN